MTSTASAALANLAQINKLKREPPNRDECTSMLRSARVRLHDARQVTLSMESRFDLAYNAAHAAALTALRFHGYRSDSRYLVFQCLAHTVNWCPEQWLILDQAHNKRNLFEYEGDLDVTEGFITELIENVHGLIIATQILITASLS